MLMMSVEFYLNENRYNSLINSLFWVDWHKIFVPSMSVAEVFIRGSIVYIVLFGILRFLPNRQMGAVGIADLLVVVLFVEAAQNAMVSDYTSITDGLILLATIISWNYVVNCLSYKFPGFQRFLTPPPLVLVENGIIIYRNMRRELITESELMTQLRKQGVEKLEEVKMAFIESDGSISVIQQELKVIDD